MCDYSLGGLKNRLAVEGEDLVVYRFPTYSIGLASPADMQTVPLVIQGERWWQRLRRIVVAAFDAPGPPAVCVPPGAWLALRNIPLSMQREWRIGPEEIVSFVQTSAKFNTYRDALQFRNGECVSLQHIAEGVPVRVLSLGGGVSDVLIPASAAPHEPYAA